MTGRQRALASFLNVIHNTEEDRSGTRRVSVCEFDEG